MSLGLQFLRSVIDNRALPGLRQCFPTWFTEAELPHYQTILEHVSRFGSLPSYETLVAAGVRLMQAPEPLEFYLSRMQDRAIYDAVQRRHIDYTESVRSRDMGRLLDTLRGMLVDARAVARSEDMVSLISEAWAVSAAHDIAHRSYSLLGVPLGWDCVDEITQGGQPGDVIVLVGRPGIGKTGSALWMTSAAWNSGRPILFCSMEMGSQQIARRMIGIRSGLNPNVIRAGRLTTFGQDTMHATIESFGEMPPFNILTGNFRKRVSDIERAAEEMRPALIVVDAAYLVGSDAVAKNKSRRESIADVITELKVLAENLHVPILITVQFNREVRRSQKTALDLAQIGESDAIGQIASVVLGMRPANSPNERTRRHFEVLKNREGDGIVFETNFSFAPVDMSFVRFVPLTEDGSDERGPDERPEDV